MRIWIVIALAATGCLRSTAYHCESSDQCGAGGTCQSSVGGYCSFADSSCGGQRFGPQAGPYANQCVTPDQQIDAGIDGMMGDGPPGSHCPTGYNTIPNGTPGHRYKLSPINDQWSQQVTTCSGTFTYLAIPNDATELGALDTLIGLSPTYWVGIDDNATEGVFLTVKNTAATFLPWQAPAPDNGPPPENCVEAITAVAMFNDAKCSIQHPAICECDP